jgi:hypothetical protein
MKRNVMEINELHEAECLWSWCLLRWSRNSPHFVNTKIYFLLHDIPPFVPILTKFIYCLSKFAIIIWWSISETVLFENSYSKCNWMSSLTCQDVIIILSLLYGTVQAHIWMFRCKDLRVSLW